MATSQSGGTTIISKATAIAVDEFQATAGTPLTEAQIVAALVTLIKGAL
jgi:hypothetical protein